jgi:hypothetical protein
MDTILAATPLRHSVSKSYTFSEGISIRKIQPILWELSAARQYMSDREREDLSGARYWLSVSKEVEHWSIGSHDDLYDKARHAMCALQIICPKGGRNVYLRFRETPEGFDNIGSFHPAKMESTPMGHMSVLEEQVLLEDFGKIYRGVNRAFDEKIVRLQNPIILLEHGLQTSHLYLSTLMWVMGLDMLFMAGEKVPFIERVAGFLGANTPVFPVVSFLNRQQPRLTVGEVLEDVYELRNIVAHGREIPERFREKCDIVDTKDAKIGFRDDYSYSGVIMEAALFLLAMSLQQIMLGDLGDTVKDEAKWKQRLKVDARLEQERAKAGR